MNIAQLLFLFDSQWKINDLYITNHYYGVMYFISFFFDTWECNT